MQKPPLMMITPDNLKVEFFGKQDHHHSLWVIEHSSAHVSKLWLHLTKATFPFGQVPKSLMVSGYEPGRKDHEFDPRLVNFFPVICKTCTSLVHAVYTMLSLPVTQERNLNNELHSVPAHTQLCKESFWHMTTVHIWGCIHSNKFNTSFVVG